MSNFHSTNWNNFPHGPPAPLYNINDKVFCTFRRSSPPRYCRRPCYRPFLISNYEYDDDEETWFYTLRLHRPREAQLAYVSETEIVRPAAWDGDEVYIRLVSDSSEGLQVRAWISRVVFEGGDLEYTLQFNEATVSGALFDDVMRRE